MRNSHTSNELLRICIPTAEMDLKQINKCSNQRIIEVEIFQSDEVAESLSSPLSILYCRCCFDYLEYLSVWPPSQEKVTPYFQISCTAACLSLLPMAVHLCSIVAARPHTCFIASTHHGPAFNLLLAPAKLLLGPTRAKDGAKSSQMQNSPRIPAVPSPAFQRPRVAVLPAGALTASPGW